MSGLMDTAKSLARAAISYRYNRLDAKFAKIALQTLEAQGSPLPDTLRKRCDAYAVEVLGQAKYAPWLYVYAHVAGEFRDGWITDSFYGERVVPRIAGAYGEVSTLRSLNVRLFDAPEFPDLGAHVHGIFTDRDGNAVAEEHIADALFASDDRIAFKTDLSQAGEGVMFFDRASFDLAAIRRLGNGVFQGFIHQNPVFLELSGSPSVATVRLTTASDDSGKVSLRAAFLRLGRASDDHIRSASHLRIPLDHTSGQLADECYMTNWQRIARHPDSNKAFADYAVPNFADCRNVAIRCHEKLPAVRCIGWDMAVDRDGKVKIIEWNGGHNDVKFGEATQGPCFADLNWHRFRA
ncbi:MAG: sugar-transfer associated ATP-grasp domain-containing protein [Paracoccaceae bacterium]